MRQGVKTSRTKLKKTSSTKQSKAIKIVTPKQEKQFIAELVASSLKVQEKERSRPKTKATPDTLEFLSGSYGIRVLRSARMTPLEKFPQLNRVPELHARGWSYAKIAEELGVPYRAACEFGRSRGLAKHRRYEAEMRGTSYKIESYSRQELYHFSSLARRIAYHLFDEYYVSCRANHIEGVSTCKVELEDLARFGLSYPPRAPKRSLPPPVLTVVR